MYIKKLTLINYRQYAGKVVFDFASSPKKNITVIQGITGSGKSCIYNAIHWALYDEDNTVNKDDPKNVEGQLNTPIFRSLDIGDEKKVCVKIDFGYENTTELTVERSVSIKKTDKHRHARREKKFQVFQKKEDEGSLVVIEDQNKKEKIINNQFPKKISDLFFFDGEKLSEFFNPKKNKEIEGYVKQATGIDIVERIISRLGTLSRDLEGKVNQVGNKDLFKVSSELEKVNKKLKAATDDLKEKELNAKSLSDEIEEDELNQKEFSEIEEKKRNQSNLKDSIKNYDKRIDECRKDYLDYIAKNGPAYILEKELKGFVSLAEKYDEEGKLPPDINPKFIEKILCNDDPECICGTLVDEKMKTKLVELSKKESLFEESRIYMEGRTNLKNSLKTVENFDDKLAEIHDNIELARIERNKAQLLFDEIEEELRNIDIEEVRSLQAKIENNRNTLKDLLIKIGEKKNIVKQLTKKQKTSEGKRARIVKAKSEGDKNYKKLEIIAQSIENFEEYKDDALDKIRLELAETTETLFKKMIWKDDAFDSVQLGENYRFKVLKSGLDCFSTLSAGEGMTLAFSFIAALSSIAGVYNPLVIDTPIARIDSEGKDPAGKVIESIVEQLEGFQTTWLMTGREYSGNVKVSLSERLGKFYELNFANNKTTFSEQQ